MSHTYSEYVDIATCPACGDPIDYCTGHGPMRDSLGARILSDHDNGVHLTCHPASECHLDEAEVAAPERIIIGALGVVAFLLILWASLLVILPGGGA